MSYIIITAIILNTLAYFIPKRISKVEIYATSVFAALFAILTDVYLDLKYNLYWYFSKEGIEWRWMIVLLGGKPATNILFLNFFPFQSRKFKKFIYILVWAVIVTLMELGSVYADILHYGKWNIWYSAILYPFLMAILYFNYKFVSFLAKK